MRHRSSRSGQDLTSHSRSSSSSALPWPDVAAWHDNVAGVGDATCQPAAVPLAHDVLLSRHDRHRTADVGDVESPYREGRDVVVDHPARSRHQPLVQTIAQHQADRLREIDRAGKVFHWSENR